MARAREGRIKKETYYLADIEEMFPDVRGGMAGCASRA